ncbi:hypothetical protein DFJ74DRAFT_713487 [Hyaloraphidium curvatum]|nr:hypothetical protein DFJ74DRAFT_713487 [Hyaloraphidium curvatum]
MDHLPVPASFMPREWLALVPRSQPSQRALIFASGGTPSDSAAAWKCSPADLATAARASDPLTRNALLGELPPLFRVLVRAQFALWPVGRRLAVRFYGFVASLLTVLGLGWYFDDGRFGSAQIAASFAGFAGGFAFLSIYPFIPSNRLAHEGRAESGDGLDMGTHYLAGFARWSQLVRAGHAAAGAQQAEAGTVSGAVSRLISHREKDPFCACDRSSCAGGIGRTGGVQQLVKILVVLATHFGAYLCPVVTPLFTFGAPFWTTWWSALMGVVFVFMVLWFAVPGVVGVPSSPSAILDLHRRLGKRAVDTAFGSFFERYSVALEGGVSEAELQELIGNRELYVDLHNQLAPALSWGVGVQLVGPVNMFLALVFFTLCATITSAVGSCITFGPLALLLRTGGCFAVDLSMLSLANLAVDDLAGVYHEAQQRIREMLADAARPRAGPPPPAEVVNALRAHDALLSSFLGIERHRYRLFGFPVSFSLIRTVVVTVVTLTVGLWGILRGFGIFVTIQSYCPHR